MPPLPAGRPRYDDPEPLGINFFRTSVEGDLAGLTLPRTFFGRSEIRDASFHNTDLSESTLCWCDFVGVDFTDACLRDSDLRASNFERVRFDRGDLRNADLRMSGFTDCSFVDAMMSGAKLTRDQEGTLLLSPQQRMEVDWQTDEGDEPDGG